MKKKFFPIIFLVIILPFAILKAQIESYLDGAMVTNIQKEGKHLWFSTYGQGIYRYSESDQKWLNYSTKNQNAENDFFYSIALNDRYLWAGSVEGLYILDLKRNLWRKRKFAQGGEMGNWIRSLYYDKQKDVLWIGRFKNLTRLDVKNNRYTDIDLTQKADSKTNNFKVIKADGDSLIWFGTESGMHIYDKAKNFEDKSAWKFMSNKNGFNGDGDEVSVPDILFEENNIWFATDEFLTEEQPNFNVGGIYKFNRKQKWGRISKTEGLAGNGIYCFERTGNLIWAGLYDFNEKDKKDYSRGIALVNRYTENISRLEINSVNFNSLRVISLFFDSASMWIGTDSGLYKIKIDNPLAHFNTRNGDKFHKGKNK